MEKDKQYLHLRRKIDLMNRNFCLQENKNNIDTIPEIEGKTCCDILKSHHNSLKDDPDRLSTDFIKTLSKCECRDSVD